MIDLYTWTTPNGRKASIMLEEVGLPYAVHPVDIGQREQFEPDFLKISPNNKIPAIVDPDGPDGKPISVFESGAVLIYLAEKTGKLLPADPHGRFAALQWLMFQMGGIGPFLGQAFHFLYAAPEDIPYAKTRYQDEARRLLAVMDRRLSSVAYLAGDYSIADVASHPWVSAAPKLDIELAPYPHLGRWLEEVAARPAVIKGMDVP